MDSPPCPESLRTIRKTVIDELLKGKEFTNKLQTLLQKPPEDCGGPDLSAEELTVQISRSFTEIISILNSCGVNGTSQIVPIDGAVRVSSGGRSSKSSDHGRKRSGPKDRRGCYKRRNVSQSWVVFSPTTEDEYAWRKYGQKQIQNTKFPRCYFRCTHKHDQGCKATKRAQKIREDPLTYQTTYFGKHSCHNTLMRVPQIISDSDPMESGLISFEARTPTNQGTRFSNYAMIAPAANQELKAETQSDASDNKSCLDSSMLQDPVTSESSGPGKVKSLNDGAHFEEVVSSMHSCSSTPLHDLDMEAFSAKFGDLDHDLYNDVEFL